MSIVTLLNPTTWAISMGIRDASNIIGGGSSGECNDSNWIIDPYCAITKFVLDIQSLLSVYMVNFGQTFLTTNTNSNLLTQASSQNNAIVQSGWGIVRNIANAALVIGLIIIAITIILGYQDNKAKQVLINFILIALLINFTPVICAFIIDGANIITNSLLAGGTDTGFGGAITNAFSILQKTSMAPAEKIAEGSIYFVFSLIAMVIMFLYGLLFMARTVILWILVIVSPIAFATKVFPQSKYIRKIFPSVTYWDDWWEQFIQWAVIGIPAAIFLYVSIQLMSVAGAGLSAMTSENTINTLMTFATPFIFLIAGFMITISAGGQVGATIGSFATGYLWGKTGGKVLNTAKEVGEKGMTMAKEGAVGIGGAALSGKNPLSFENREEGRRVLDKLSFGGPSPKDDKENAQEYLKSHPGAYDFKIREGLKKSQIRKDAGDYIGDAKNLDELKLAIKDVEALGGSKAKEDAAISIAGKRNDIPGSDKLYKDFIVNNKINIAQKISGMNDKTAQKELGEKKLGNYEIFKNMNPSAITGILKIGSDAQRKTILSNYGGGNSDFKAHARDLQIKSTEPSNPNRERDLKEYRKLEENVLAVLDYKNNGKS
ncbi:MAG: hypothetical protein WA091_02415 [Minisyncoccales bacterium]